MDNSVTEWEPNFVTFNNFFANSLQPVMTSCFLLGSNFFILNKGILVHILLKKDHWEPLDWIVM